MRIPVVGYLAKVARSIRQKRASLPSGGSWYNGWVPLIRENFTGAWQRNITIERDDVLTSGVVFSCYTLIASDIAKLWLDLVAVDANLISRAVNVAAFSPVLRRPNHFQNTIQFVLHWILTKLIHGNVFVLKRRDLRGVVQALYILDSQDVTVQVAPDGSVFYRISIDPLSGVDEDSQLMIPAREIIHDRMYTPFHPLLGVGPIVACGLSAMQTRKIQNQSTRLFQNNLLIAGVLTTPNEISNEAAEKFERHWDANFTGERGAGKTALLTGGMKFEPMVTRAVDAQLIEQLRWTGEDICRCFHMPAYKVGVGPAPTYNNIQALNIEYYSDCLQILIESLERCLDDGLELPAPYRTEFDLDALLRMDTLTAVDVATKGILGGLYKPNEGRAKMNLSPVEGGDTCYLQQQNYSLAALNRRDQAMPAPATPGTETNRLAAAPDYEDEPSDKKIADLFRKELGMAA